MKQVFRYPYYREMEYADYSESNITPEELSDIQIETGADIVVMPVITEWSQWVSYPFAIFRDVDPIVETRVSVDIYSLKKGEKLRRDSASYFEREEEGLVRNEYIMDALMKRLWKKFPYRRVPTDISPNLSGEIKGENKTPTATMNK